MGVARMRKFAEKLVISWLINMDVGNELGLIGTIDDDDDYEPDKTEDDSDDEVHLILLAVCTWNRAIGGCTKRVS